MPLDLTNTYAGDLSPTEAWRLLEQNTAAQLVDVRTNAEWSYVGLPDLGGLNRRAHCVEWQGFPSMAVKGDFVEAASAVLGNAGATTDTPVLFLCRSGARSRSAAIAMAQAGFTKAYNIAGGFEGDLDSDRHRGGKNGWKAAGLPWRQT